MSLICSMHVFFSSMFCLLLHVDGCVVWRVCGVCVVWCVCGVCVGQSFTRHHLLVLVFLCYLGDLDGDWRLYGWGSVATIFLVS